MPQSTLDRAQAITQHYAGIDGTPTRETWNRIAGLAEDQPVAMVNHFRLHRQALYPSGSVEAQQGPISGQDAFDRYATVSMPALARAGGEFLMVTPFAFTFIGSDEAWDLVVVGRYPNPSAVFALFEDPLYRAAYHHRTAACAAQRTGLCLG